MEAVFTQALAAPKISPPRSPLRCAFRVACATTSPRPRCRFNWLMNVLSEDAGRWIIVLVRRLEQSKIVRRRKIQGERRPTALGPTRFVL
jgi:hypothetical protein